MFTKGQVRLITCMHVYIHWLNVGKGRRFLLIEYFVCIRSTGMTCIHVYAYRPNVRKGKGKAGASPLGKPAKPAPPLLKTKPPAGEDSDTSEVETPTSDESEQAASSLAIKRQLSSHPGAMNS